MSVQPRPEYPRPDLVRSRWQNLNGRWQFCLDQGLSGVSRGLPEADRELPQEILVPFCPESQLSGIGNRDFMHGVWYRREFTVPDSWQNQRIILHFGAVDYHTRVWVNGTQVGAHRGGYTPFSFDVTHALRAGTNVVTVFAEDDTRSPLQPSGKQALRYESHGCHYTRTTGIWQTVWMEPVPPAHVLRIRVISEPEASQLRVNVYASNDAHGARVEIRVMADGEPVGSGSAHVVGDTALVTVALASIRLWTPSDPFLYDLTISLHSADGRVDTVSSYAGLRTLGIRGAALLLNGNPRFQRLVLDQGFYPQGVYTAPSDDDLRRDIEISQAAGYDGARLHMRVFEPRFLYWADKLGYLCWGEYPNWGLDVSTPASLVRVQEEWLSVLARDANHPSIVGWCPFNETHQSPPRDPDVLRQIYRVTKLVDPTRPCIDTSGYVHTESTDVYDSHCYEQDVAKFAARFEEMRTGGDVWRNFPAEDAPWTGQPYFVSEYGGIWWNPGQKDETSWGYGNRPKTEEEFVARYKGLTSCLLNHPKMCGFCYTQLYDVEQEVNGIYTYAREPKFDPRIFREINQQKAAIEG